MAKFCASTCFWARSIELRDHAVLDGDALLHAQLQHQAADAVGAEDAHEVVLERQVETGGAGIALAARAAAQLVVDAPRLVALGGQDVEAAQGHHPLALVRRPGAPRSSRTPGSPAISSRSAFSGCTARKSTGFSTCGIEDLAIFSLSRRGRSRTVSRYARGAESPPRRGRGMRCHRRVVGREAGQEADVALGQRRRCPRRVSLRSPCAFLYSARHLARAPGRWRPGGPRGRPARGRSPARRGWPWRGGRGRRPRMMSVPRPAMLVAMVTAPKRPAWATISASRSWYFAFSTTCLMPAFLSREDRCSDFSMEMVPTSTGRPESCSSSISLTTASNFSRLRPVDDVRVLHPDEGAVRGDGQDLELVDLVELGGLRLRRARHARELPVHAEVVLEGDGGEGLVLALDLHLLLGLHRLVEPVRPAPAGHEAARELVDDHDLPVLHHVVDVALEERVRAQALVDVVEHVHVRRVPEVLDPQQLLGVEPCPAR